LVAENRFVGAALLPAVVAREVDRDVRRVFERQQLYRELDEKDEEVKKALDSQTNKSIEPKK
jgi:hypothetical protein